jgi:hypothetical protein
LCDIILSNELSLETPIIYEFYNFIEIKNGKITQLRKIDNKVNQCGKYKTMQDLNDEIEKDLNLNAKIATNIKFDLDFEINNDGIPKNITINGTQDSLIIKDIIMVIESLDGLPVYYRNGEPAYRKFEGTFEINR